MQKIEDMLRDAETQREAMGADNFHERLYSRASTPDFLCLKEEFYLGYFAQEYNKSYLPELVWACHHPPRSSRADFSVYASNQTHLCDIEVTAIFSKPKTKNPKGYEDYSPFPVRPDPLVPGAILQDIDSPPKVQPYAWLKRVIETHFRNKYPPYWLVVYDNEHGVQHPNLNGLASLIRQILEAKATRGQLPLNLQQVWVFDLPGVVRVFP